MGGDAALRKEIDKLKEEDWNQLPAREGGFSKEKRYWAEVPFVPDDREAHKGERPFRYIAIKLPPRDVQLDLFEAPPEERYVALVTNRDLPAAELIHWHREKCGTVEQAHDRLRACFGGHSSARGRAKRCQARSADEGDIGGIVEEARRSMAALEPAEARTAHRSRLYGMTWARGSSPRDSSGRTRPGTAWR